MRVASAKRRQHRRQRLPGETARRWRLAGVAAWLAVLTPAELTAATVELKVSGVAPGGGPVLASLCEGGLDRDTCRRGQRQSAEAQVLTFVFPDLEPGRYAALAFQDEAGDGELRRSRMGRPLEPYGLSNSAGRSRRPTFEQAAFRLGEGGARVAVRLERPTAP